MATYVTLMKFTKKAMGNIHEVPGSIEPTVKRMEELGAKLLCVYYTMGEYDMVAISEWPSDEAAFGFTIELGAYGNVRTMNLKAFSQEQFAAAVAAVPEIDD